MVKILWLTIKHVDSAGKNANIRSHFDNWYLDLAKYCDINFRIRDITQKSARSFFDTHINSSLSSSVASVPQIIRDTKSNVRFYPAIRLDNVNQKYDWLITDFSYAFLTEDWDKIKIPKAMIIEDSNSGLPSIQMEKAVNQKFDIVFCRYKREFYKYQKEYLKKFHDIKWLPWSVGLDMFKDYGLEKKYDVTMTGFHNIPFYHYRDMVFDEIGDKEYFTELKHYGYTKKKESVYGVDYAKFLNQSKISCTGGMVYNRPVMKFYEIPASRCLLASNTFEELEELGFKDGENMVVYNYRNIDKQMKNLLADNAMRQEITDNGYNFIRKYHSGEVRAQQFIKELK